MSTLKTPIQFYHGGREWFGKFELNPKSSGVMEHGPGLYLTNGIETARHYAKGGGVVQLISFDPDAKLIEHISTPVAEMSQFLLANSIRHAKKIIECLQECSERMQSDSIPLENLNNLMINFKSLVPSAALPLNEFILSQGADISVFDAPMFNSHGSGRDEWVVVYNPDSLISRQRVDMKNFDWSTTHLPRYDIQMTLKNQTSLGDDYKLGQMQQTSTRMVSSASTMLP